MALLNLQHIYKSYDQLAVLHDISLSVEQGEFVCLVGPSGSGKSTLFGLLAGLEKPDSGTIEYAGKPLRPGATGYMFQRDLLLPWRTVLDNVALGLELQKMSRREARQQALALFEQFGLKGFEQSYPWQLSGGMRQRAALLRTILTGRDLLLLDEPFGALDALTRADLQGWLLDVWASTRRTILFITHDVEEALLLSDRVYCLSARPASIKLVEEVRLPRPRDPASPDFGAAKKRLLAALLPAQRASQEADLA